MDGVPTTKLTVVVLVIFYNLISAYLKKRAKKKAEDAVRNGGTVVDRGVTVSTSTKEAVARKRETPVRTARTEDDEIVQAWDEKPFRAEDEEGANPYRENTRPPAMRPAQMPAPAPTASSAAKPTASPTPARPPASMGKDLLTQLAREIGLDLPEAPYSRKPAPGATPPKGPVPTPAFAPIRNKRVTSYDDDDHARTVADSLPGNDLTSAPGIAAVESANAAAYVTRDPLRPTALTALRADLYDSESFRRAFILKTVLDKPLSLQPRAPGS